MGTANIAVPAVIALLRIPDIVVVYVIVCASVRRGFRRALDQHNQYRHNNRNGLGYVRRARLLVDVLVWCEIVASHTCSLFSLAQR